MKDDHERPLDRGALVVLFALGLVQGPVDAAVILKPENEDPLDELPEKAGKGLEDFPEKSFHLLGPFFGDGLGGQGHQFGDLQEQGTQQVPQDHLKGKHPAAYGPHEPADNEKINQGVPGRKPRLAAMNSLVNEAYGAGQAKADAQPQADPFRKESEVFTQENSSNNFYTEHPNPAKPE